MATDIRKLVGHTLLVPVTFEGKEHTSINLRRIKGKDIRDMERQETNLDKTFFMIGRLSEWPPEGVDEIDGEDFDAISKIIEGFMGRRRSRG